MTDLPQREVQERVALLNRFRALLTEQRDRFRSYINVLEKQEETIAKGSVEALISHVELEEKIVADIFAIQKVIIPLRDILPNASADTDTGLYGLDIAVDELKTEAAGRVKHNKELLEKRMEEIKAELNDLRAATAFNRRRSPYSGSSPSFVDIHG
jgi:hypothetical protein